MGIVNLSPDSFYGNGVEANIAAGLALDMQENGADIIDVGGESTRPGHEQITDEEETERVVPVIREIKKRFDVPVSLDTYKSRVASAGIEAGADLINDIWGCKYEKGMPVSFSDIMAGRVAYYPGSGYDGTLIKVGNRSRAVHSYLYVDYGIGKEDLIKHLAEPNSIYGYHSIGRIEWSEKDILPNGQYPLNVNKKPRTPYRGPFKSDEKPYCFTEIMERNPDKDDDFGAKKFAVTFLFADGIATYYQLFCMEYKKAPWVFLLQDHGFGGNYDEFGEGGLLDTIIKRNGIRPQFVICASNTRIWDGYKEITELPPIYDGEHNPRMLYRKSPNKG